jgi:hypothetical protein
VTFGAGSNVFYNCGGSGHFAKECTASRQIAAPRPQGHANQPPCGPPKNVAAKAGHVNYTITEDIPEGGHVLAGMLSLNGYPIVILFVSGATHDFISKAYTQKYHLAIAQTNTPYMISTPGGNVITKLKVHLGP